ncbi:EIF3J factor, partial [Picathartes gymnocephalus]|nr:EIF3J factor [Picathartes gymnocephalus]
EPKVSEKKKIAEKIKEKEKLQKKKQEELKKRLEAPEEQKELTPEEQLADKLRLKKLQEESDLELAKETFGVNNTCGIDAMNPSSKDDFTEFGKLLKEKITQYEKSLHYAGFLEALLRDVCISLEVDDLKKITNTLTVLCSEKQKQEKNKAKKKKKGVVPGGGLKATMKDDLADYGGYDGEYVQDFEDFM